MTIPPTDTPHKIALAIGAAFVAGIILAPGPLPPIVKIALALGAAIIAGFVFAQSRSSEE